jgi:hypothetical protein
MIRHSTIADYRSMVQQFSILVAIIISFAPITISFWFPTSISLFHSRKTNYYNRPTAIAAQYSEEFNNSSTNAVPNHNNSITTGMTDRFQYKVCL